MMKTGGHGFTPDCLGAVSDDKRGSDVAPFNSMHMPSGTAVTAETAFKIIGSLGVCTIKSRLSPGLPLHLKSDSKELATDHHFVPNFA